MLTGRDTLFEEHYRRATGSHQMYDVRPDGKGLVFICPVNEAIEIVVALHALPSKEQHR